MKLSKNQICCMYCHSVKKNKLDDRTASINRQTEAIALVKFFGFFSFFVAVYSCQKHI